MAAPIQIANQRYYPVGERRELTVHEQAQIDRESAKPFPKIRPGFNEPIAKMLASPRVAGAISGGLAGLTAGAAGWMLSRLIKNKTLVDGVVRHQSPYLSLPAQAAVGVAVGVLVGGLAYLGGYVGRRQKNENYIDIMSRLPEGATYRDYLSDPVVQAEKERSAMASASRSPSYYHPLFWGHPGWGGGWGSGWGGGRSWGGGGGGSSAGSGSSGSGFTGTKVGFGWGNF